MSKPEFQQTDSVFEVRLAEYQTAPEQLITRAHVFMTGNLSRTLGITAIYQNVYDQTVNESDTAAVTSQAFLESVLNPGHRHGGALVERFIADGNAFQTGVMSIDGDDPEAEKKQKPVYRALDGYTYNPDVHDGTVLHDGFCIDWKPAAADITVTPREIPEHLRVADVQPKRPEAFRRKQLTQPAAKTVVEHVINPVKPEKLPPKWAKPFQQAVQAEIAKKEAEKLMLEGEISANAITQLTNSTIIGTQKNRDLLKAAGVINAAEAQQKAPWTVDTLLAAELFNGHRDIFRHRPNAKRAVEIIQDEVAKHFEAAA